MAISSDPAAQVRDLLARRRPFDPRFPQTPVTFDLGAEEVPPENMGLYQESVGDMPPGEARRDLDARAAAQTAAAGPVLPPRPAAAGPSGALEIPGMPARSAVAPPPTPDSARKASAEARSTVDAAAEQRRLEAQRESQATPPSARRNTQRMHEAARADKEAREKNAVRPPEEVRAASAGVVKRAREQRAGERTFEQRQAEDRDLRSRDAAVKRDEEAQRKYDAERRAWETQYENAVATGNVPLQEKLMASKPMPPAPSLESTGGLTPEEIDEPVEATLDRLPPGVKPILMRKHEDRLGSGVDTNDSLNMAYAYMDPAERYDAMIREAEQYQAVNQAFPSVPQFEGTRRGFGDPKRGDTFRMTQPHVSDIRPRRYANESDSGAPRSRPSDPDSFSGSFVGNNAAGSPDMLDYAVGENFDIDGPRDNEWRRRVQIAAQELGVDMNAFDSSPRGEAMFWKEAERVVRTHLRRTGREIDPTTGQPRNMVPDGDGNFRPTQRVVGSGDPDNPYRYSSTPEAIAHREKQNLMREATKFMGAHPIPDTLKGDWDGRGVHPLHQELMDAAERGDKAEYTRIRQLIWNHEVAGRESMGVRNRQLVAQQRQMVDPRINRAVFAQSMADAEGDPARTATVFRQYGMFDEADAVERRAAEAGETQHRRDMDIEKARTESRLADAAVDKADGDEIVDADKLKDDKVDTFVRDVAAGGGGLYEATTAALGPSAKPPEIRYRVFRSAKKHGLPLSHPQLERFIEEEWRNGSYDNSLSAAEYTEQFIVNLSRASGYSTEEVRQWAKSNQKKLETWHGLSSRPVADAPPTEG